MLPLPPGPCQASNRAAARPRRETKFCWEPQIGNLRVHPGHRSSVSFVSFCSFLLCRRPGTGSEQKETKETKSPDAAAPVGSVPVYGFLDTLCDESPVKFIL